MARFCIAFLHSPQLETSLLMRGLKLSYAISPNQVKVPKSTIFFTFMEADVETVDELISSIVIIKFGSVISFASPIISNGENKKLYIIGQKQILPNGVESVYNQYTQTAFPIQHLKDNYEIIDM